MYCRLMSSWAASTSLPSTMASPNIHQLVPARDGFRPVDSRSGPCCPDRWIHEGMCPPHVVVVCPLVVTRVMLSAVVVVPRRL